MRQKLIEKKVIELQAQLELVKQTLKKEPDFDIDEKNWSIIKSDVKKIKK